MDIDLLIIIGFVGVGIGFLTARLLSALRENDADTPQRSLDGSIVVGRDPSTDELVVEIGGNAYENMIELRSEDRHHLQLILLQLNEWLDPQGPEISASGDVPSETQPEEGDASTEKSSLPRFRPVSMIADALRADVPKIGPKMKSIVGQIDEILQEKIGVSGYADVPVKLMEIPGRGMVVMVGLDRYNEIDDVPDAEIRDLIRSAIQEWENQDLA